MSTNRTARWRKWLDGTTGRVVAVYALVATAWIVLSDYAVEYLFTNPGAVAGAQTLKGVLFVVVTALSLYLLIRHLVGQLRTVDQARQNQEQRFHDFSYAANDWLWETGPDHRFTYVSAHRGGSDRPDGSLIGRTRVELMAEDIDPALRQRHLDDLQNRRSFRDFVYPLRSAAGTHRYVRISGNPRFDENGAFLGYRGVAADVTAEIESRQARDRLAEIVEVSPNFTGTAEIDGRVLFINPAGRAMLGIDPDEDVTRHDFATLYMPDTARRMREEIVPAAVRERKWTGEVEFRRRDGGRIAVLQEIIVHREHENTAPFLSLIGVDLSEHYRAEQALRDREQQYRAIFEGASDGLLIFDEEGRVVEINPAGCGLFGYSRAEMIGRLGDALMHSDDRYRMVEFIRTVRSGGAYRARLRGLRKDQSMVTIELGGRGFTYGGGPHMLAIARDVTDREALERRLAQAQKMEAVGQLTGGIAHDFNNLLVVALGSAELLAERLSEDQRNRELAEAVLRSGRRAAELTKRLLAFARQQPLRPEPVSLNGLIAEMVPMLRRTLGETVDIETRLAEDLWPALADRAQVESCVVNLAINARDAMPNGGDLIVETRNTHLDEQPGRPSLAPGDYVVLSVTDTGSGMPPDVAARAFDPFFTTKAPGKGSGLGLSMVYGFAQQSGGNATIYSEPGLGTTVRVYLPRHNVPLREPATPPRATEMPTGGETVLVVEDEPAVREFVVGQLRLLGYTVLQAGNGADALKLLDGHEQVDLLLTDVVMPGGMSGPQLAAEVRARRLGIKVLFTSGYADPAVLARARLEPGARLLAKPYRREELARALREVLNAPDD